MEQAENLEPFDRCPKCGAQLGYFSGLEKIPSYLFCPVCNDIAYTEDGDFFAELE